MLSSMGQREQFNRGDADAFIDYMRYLICSSIDYDSCFIGYSSKDQAFAERLHADLQSKGVRCWFAQEDMDIGDKIRPRIEESIGLYDKLLLVLSKYSIASNWVAYEVERALNKEPQGKPNILFPMRLDDAVMKSKASWADDIKSTRHIGDFTNWKNPTTTRRHSTDCSALPKQNSRNTHRELHRTHIITVSWLIRWNRQLPKTNLH